MCVCVVYIVLCKFISALIIGWVLIVFGNGQKDVLNEWYIILM